MRQLLLQVFSVPFSLVTSPASTPNCKNSPQIDLWPSINDWSTLNKSIDGCLLRTAPAGSACYEGNPLNSPYNCTDVKNGWNFGVSHAAWPESISFSIFANNSCVPPGIAGHDKDKGCDIGGLPRYIVNATTEGQVAKAMAWASERNIRIVVKSTGHDFNGRYVFYRSSTAQRAVMLSINHANMNFDSATGANSLSIWTHNFRHIRHEPEWRIPGSKKTANVLICGGGAMWGSVYTAAHRAKRTIVGSEDVSVGLGGQLQNGGHGLLSSHYGLSSDHIYQVTIITSEGHRLVANDEQNQDIFWAIRGAGGGQFGVVTEFIIRTTPVPANIVQGLLTFYAQDTSRASGNASWAAFAELASQFPELMDKGLTGTVDSMTGGMAVEYIGLPMAVHGPAVKVNMMGFNSTTDRMTGTLRKLLTRLDDVSDGKLNFSLAVSTQSFWSFTKPNLTSSNFAGRSRYFTGRLLGRPALCDISKDDLTRYLQQISVAQDTERGTLLRFDLQAGFGPAHTPKERRGSAQPAWRSTYVLAMAWGASVSSTEEPKKALAGAAEWYEKNKEPVWRKWAPESGAYMNSGNAFSRTWKHDFYGDNYDRLWEIKQKYDPKESLWVYSGVGSDHWDYDLHSGLLCRADAS